MKKKNGFTLIELLAVIVILGVLMTVAIPNIISTLEKNKRDSFIKDAKMAISAAEYTMRANTKYEYPTFNQVVILPFDKLKNLNIEISPYDTFYSYSHSFVALIKSLDEDTGDSDYVYYVHLVSCTDKDCSTSLDNDEVESYRGINLRSSLELDSQNRYDLVEKGQNVVLDYLTDDGGYVSLLNDGFGFADYNQWTVIVY